MKVHPEIVNSKLPKRKVSDKTQAGGLSLLADSLRHQTTEFFNNSTLHGVRYIAEKDRPFCENTLGPTTPLNTKEMLVWLAALSYKSIEEHVATYANDPDLADLFKDGQEVRAAVLEIVHHCDTLFYECEWKGDSEECCDLLFPVFTEMGFCYAFNSRHAERTWPWQTQPQPEQFLEAFIHETDTKWSFLFNAYQNTTIIDMFIHSSVEMAGLDLSAQLSWDRRVEIMSFSVKHTYTTEDARQLSIKQRRCVFADELKLETSSVYTYSACMRQCRMKLCMAFCKCVPHFYPLIAGYRYCSVAELVCVAAHADSITDAARCACELGCEHTVYEVEKLTEIDSGKGQVSSSLETEFVSWPMVRYKREVLFGWVDLLVSFGGIAGLFLGFSLLSGVEVLYYFTLRACCSMARDRHALRREREERLAKPRPPYDLSLVPWWKQPPQKRAPSPAPGPLLVKERTRTQHSQPPQYSPPPGYTTFLP
ncbi:hypothetical protein JYU34_016375 [Plutella xylostella]|uniref:Uncharacterized protein n=1 Tax=Plutella xylostella TaxID=51655 RepID=A0ABQ7Q2H6_PLUXY|nr:hypothetical protein JYU34_016375 [Plutella xylostella]